jgi:hypothetical protein
VGGPYGPSVDSFYLWVVYGDFYLSVMTSPLNGWAFGSGRFLLSGFALNMKLDLLLLLNNDDETFSTHTSSEATGMTRITLNIFDVTPLRAVAIAIALSFMAFTPVAAQDHQKGLDAYNAGDYATALREWLPLADQGHGYAQYNVGLLYDPMRIYETSTLYGDALAFGAGVEDMGIVKSFFAAETWYRLAAAQGHVPAQNRLGRVLEVTDLDDRNEALMWYKISALNGLDSGASNYNRLRRSYFVDEDQLETLARECIRGGYAPVYCY